MAIGIAQKSYKGLFPLWSLKKKDILKVTKKNHADKKDWKHWEEFWYWNIEKGENYTYHVLLEF